MRIMTDPSGRDGRRRPWRSDRGRALGAVAMVGVLVPAAVQGWAGRDRGGSSAGPPVVITVPTSPPTTAPPTVTTTPAPAGLIPKFTRALPVPPVVDATRGGLVVLKAQRSKVQEFVPGRPTLTYGYRAFGPRTPAGGVGLPYLGPTIEARRDVPVTITAVNELQGSHPATLWCPPGAAGCDPVGGALDLGLHGMTAADVRSPREAVHRHGANEAQRADGGPQDTFRPGGTWIYEYANAQDATTLWYHDHAGGMTRSNVVAGLAGMYLLRDAYDTGRSSNPLGLPAGRYEVPLVVQDRSFHADGSVSYPPGDLRTWAPEYFGDTALVNGMPWPNLDVEQAVYRFRLLNGSNARFYDFTLSGNGAAAARIYQVGSDGGMLNAPVPLTHLTLGPGERADLLVDFTAVPGGSRLVLANGAPAPFTGDLAAPSDAPLVPEIMQFSVGRRSSSDGMRTTVPARLRGGPGQQVAIPDASPALAAQTRSISLTELLDPATGSPLMLMLNGIGYQQAVDDRALQERPRANTWEVWEFVNATGDTHPMHLHLTQFRVLSRQAIDGDAYAARVLADRTQRSAAPFLLGTPRGPEANEVGWKDTVQVNPGEVVRVLVPFGGRRTLGNAVPYTATRTGTYVFHCHILEHEDNDMMLPYTVR